MTSDTRTKTASWCCKVLSTFAFGLLLIGCVDAMQPARRETEYCRPGSAYLRKKYPAQTVQIPIDHFKNESRYEPHSNDTFSNRFWFDASYYRPGGPVIIENNGEDPSPYLPDLDVGLLHELAKATGGVAVLFEHRYYGDQPIRVRTNKDFRFLSVEQAMADQAYFAQNVVFPGLEDIDLTAPNTPWFAMGGSYPGALTAWIRIQYPDLFFGAIASSAVTAVQENYWGYYDVVRQYSPPDCVDVFGKIVNIADNILLGGNQTAIAQLKGLFRYGDLSGSNADFAYFSLYFPYTLQNHNWIPCISRSESLEACRILTWNEPLYPKAEKLRSDVKEIIQQSEWAEEEKRLTTSMLNFLGYSNGYEKLNGTATNATTTSAHRFRGLSNPSEKLTYSNQTFTWSEGLLAWFWQQCTELGFFQTAEAPPASTLPVISSLITLHYLRKMSCQDVLYLNLTELSTSKKLYEYGNFNISYDRLLLTGGEWDPWRPATALATHSGNEPPTRLNYSSTPDQPWYLIPGGSHEWDLEGVSSNQTQPGVPPESIVDVHRLEKESILRWLGEWKALHSKGIL